MTTLDLAAVAQKGKFRTVFHDSGNAQALILQIEGRVAGAFVPELESCWNAARARQPNWKISVDLKNVTCVDRAGRTLLQLMHSDGVEFLRAGMAIQDILEQVMERQCGS